MAYCNKDIEGTNIIFVNADKSGNLHKMSLNKYKQMLHKEVNKHYKIAPRDLEADLNKEAELLASKFKIEDRMEKFNIKNVFITLLDHKSVFRSNLTCRLINPTKTRKIGKVILQDICGTHRIALNINWWCNSNDRIKCFKDCNKNDKCSFIKYDIKEFYPSITEKNCKWSIKSSRGIYVDIGI